MPSGTLAQRAAHAARQRRWYERNRKKTHHPQPCLCCGEQLVGKRSTKKFCSKACCDKHSHQRNADKRRQWFREYQRKRRAAGLNKKYARRTKRSDEGRKRELARLRAYWHAHKDKYRGRSRLGRKRRPHTQQDNEKRWNRRWKHAPNTERECRSVLLELRRWCKANGFTGYRELLGGSK